MIQKKYTMAMSTMIAILGILRWISQINFKTQTLTMDLLIGVVKN